MFIVMTKSAAMPQSCKGVYRRIAVVELEDGFDGEPKMISERAHGVKRIVATWEKLHVGKTRGAYWDALAEATEMAAEYNRIVRESTWIPATA